MCEKETARKKQLTELESVAKSVPVSVTGKVAAKQADFQGRNDLIFLAGFLVGAVCPGKKPESGAFLRSRAQAVDLHGIAKIR